MNLTNLESIMCSNPENVSSGHRVHHVLNNAALLAPKTACLSRLRSIYIDPLTDDGYADFDCLGAFTAIPSVCSIMGKLIPKFQPLIYLRPLTLTLNLTNLTLLDCAIEVRHIFELLANLHQLKYFLYSPGGDGVDTRDIDPFWIRSGLLASSATTLESLTLLSIGQPKYFMGCLEGFTQLLYLETDLELFLGPLDIIYHILEATLPFPIETVILEVDHPNNIQHYGKLMQDFVVSKRRCDNLCQVHFAGVPDAKVKMDEHAGLITRLQDVGIDFQFLTM